MLAPLQVAPPERPAGSGSVPRATTPAAPPASVPRFADLLQRGQATHGVLSKPVEPPQAPAEKPALGGVDPAGDGESHDGSAPARHFTAAAASAKAPSRARPKSTASSPTTPPSPTGTAANDGASAATARDPAHRVTCGVLPAGAQAADLCDWRAAMTAPAKPAADASAQGLADTGGNTPIPTAAAGGPSGAGAPAAPGHDEGQGSGSTASAAAPQGERSALAALALTASPDRRAAPSEASPPRDASQGLLSGAGAVVPRGFDPGSMAPIVLAAPVYSPEFAQALGAQVSLLARDGTQEAELHLNPAEMGPINVRIAIEGEQARVDFSASTAETRGIIERGLPELASALREQGLTLAGGGVFQQAGEQREPSRRESAGAASQMRRAGAGVAASAPRTMGIVPSQGRLDLYA